MTDSGTDPSSEGISFNDHLWHVDLELRGGHKYQLALPDGSPLLQTLHGVRLGRDTTRAHTDPVLLQLPLAHGNESLSFSSKDIIHLRFPNAGEHVAMNTSEGYLGGYISARHPRSAELGMKHGDSATWTPQLWRWIHAELEIKSVLDVGCAEGHAAAFFEQLGCRISGVDGSKLALRDSVIPEHHVQHDYTEGPYLPATDYDLVWCCEFVEHVEERFVDNFLATFNTAGKYIFMTAAQPGQPGWHHVNCQLPGYWIEKIQRMGFQFQQELTNTARQLAKSGHFSRQGLVFARDKLP